MNKISLILGVIGVLTCNTSLAIAEQPNFHMDVDFQQVTKLFGYRTLNDLKIGETVTVYGVEMCWNSADKSTSIISSTPISEQPGGIDITRVSTNAVNISNFPVPTKDSESYKITQFINRIEPHPCNVLQTVLGENTQMLNVATINGQTALSGLLDTGSK